MEPRTRCRLCGGMLVGKNHSNGNWSCKHDPGRIAPKVARAFSDFLRIGTWASAPADPRGGGFNHAKVALDLARAEVWYKWQQDPEAEVRLVWEDEHEPYDGDDPGGVIARRLESGRYVMACLMLYDAEDNVLDSLGGIVLDTENRRDDIRRFEAEMIDNHLDAMSNVLTDEEYYRIHAL